MRVLNICQDDWANFMHDNMMALRSVGVHCDAVKRNLHPMGYLQQAGIEPSVSRIMQLIRQYDVIQFFHDNVQLLRILEPALSGKAVIIYHTSSIYRRDHALLNPCMNKLAHRCVNAMPEFMGMGAKNEIYMVGAVDTDRIRPTGRSVEKPYRFAHYPSNQQVKGTDKIVDLMQRTGAYFTYSKDSVKYDYQLQRMADCDVYIEMFTNRDGYGSPYGDFGITCLEAAAMGKIVITNLRHKQVYKDYYNGFFLYLPETEDEFVAMVREIDSYPEDRMHMLQTELSRKWVETNHSYTASGKYMLKHILHDL